MICFNNHTLWREPLFRMLGHEPSSEAVPQSGGEGGVSALLHFSNRGQPSSSQFQEQLAKNASQKREGLFLLSINY